MAYVLDFIPFAVVFGFLAGLLAERATGHTSEQS